MRCVISLPCPTCGSELAFLDQYQRHYCYACGNYAPEGYGDRGAKICPTCRGIFRNVAQYDPKYCYRCNAYPADGVALRSLEDTMPVDVRPVDVRPVAEATEATSVVTEPETTTEEVEAAKPTDVEPTAEPEKTEAPTIPTTPTPAEASPQPEEIVVEELPREEPKEPGPRPPIVRLKVFQAKKPALMDLCKAYDLDPTGTKEQLRERLLSYLDTLEAEAEPEPEVESEAPAGPVLIERAEIEGESFHTSEEIAETPAVEAEPESEQPASRTSVAETPVVETQATQEPVAERIRTPSSVSIPQSQPLVSVAPAVEPMHALHPCPTCGRELTYIARYRRWYCSSLTRCSSTYRLPSPIAQESPSLQTSRSVSGSSPSCSSRSAPSWACRPCAIDAETAKVFPGRAVRRRAMRLQQVVKDERRPREFDPREYISTWRRRTCSTGKSSMHGSSSSGPAAATGRAPAAARCADA